MIDYGILLFNHLNDCFHSCDRSSYTVSNDACMDMVGLFRDKRFGLGRMPYYPALILVFIIYMYYLDCIENFSHIMPFENTM